MKCSFSINAITYKLSHLRLTVKLYYQEKMSVLTRVIALKDFHERNFVPTFFFFFGLSDFGRFLPNIFCEKMSLITSI